MSEVLRALWITLAILGVFIGLFGSGWYVLGARERAKAGSYSAAIVYAAAMSLVELLLLALVVATTDRCVRDFTRTHLLQALLDLWLLFWYLGPTYRAWRFTHRNRDGNTTGRPKAHPQGFAPAAQTPTETHTRRG